MPTTKKAEQAKADTEKKATPVAKKKTGPKGPRKNLRSETPSKFHIGQMIEQKMKAAGMSKNKLARILKLTPPSISLMIESSSVQTERLAALSEALSYNFFSDIASKIGISNAKGHDDAADNKTLGLQSKMMEMEREMKYLRDENAYLKKILELLAGGKK
jgi:plasmid maintenance system antidote protein VapI